MNWEKIEVEWEMVQGSVVNRWEKLRNEELSEIGGDREKLVRKIREHYGVREEEAERQIDDWLARF